VGSGRSSIWVAWVGDEPLHAGVSSVARRSVRRSWTRLVVSGLVRLKKTGGTEFNATA
jgi:hypothetical protein